MAALTVWPLARLGEGLGLEPLDAARAAAVLVILPGPALFAGTLDAALALPVTACAALLLSAARAGRPGRAAAAAAAAGACAAVALFGSYGAAAFLALVGVAVSAAVVRDRASPRPLRARPRSRPSSRSSSRSPCRRSSATSRSVRSRPRSPSTAREYTAPRRYDLWLAFDPLDFALFAGLPFVLIAAWRTAASVARARPADEPRAVPRRRPRGPRGAGASQA